MNKALRYGLVGLACLVTAAAMFVMTKSPDAQPPSDETYDPTPQRLARGDYLVNHLLGCFECHSERDWARYGGPTTGKPGAGGSCYGSEYEVPGTVCMPNITPHPEHGLGSWTDGEIGRAIREGVDNDGKAIFPMMPYRDYRNLSDEDLAAVVVYLRSLEPAATVVPESVIDFPVSFFVKFEPTPVTEPVHVVDTTHVLAYGEYLTTIGGCRSCHTPVDAQHQPLPGRDFSGGQEFVGPFGRPKSANITPHATGIGAMNEIAFVARFKTVLPSDREIDPNENTVMPWLAMRDLEEDDLSAIFAYLQTVPALANEVGKPTKIAAN